MQFQQAEQLWFGQSVRSQQQGSSQSRAVVPVVLERMSQFELLILTRLLAAGHPLLEKYGRVQPPTSFHIHVLGHSVPSQIGTLWFQLHVPQHRWRYFSVDQILPMLAPVLLQVSEYVPQH